MKKLNRKDFLKKAALGSLAAPTVISACNAAGEGESSGSTVDMGKKYRWKMVTTWPPNLPILQDGCKLFSKWVKEMSGGRLDIKVYGGGELVPALEAFDAVSSGTAEMGSGGAYYWAGKAPAAQFFASVPFGMNAQQRNAWMISGGGMALWRELYAKFNLVPFMAGNSGVQMGGWFNKEINTLADFKGLKMRIPGFGGDVLKKAGGTPILQAGGELYTNLERGVIDATEWIGPYHDYLMGFHEIAKYYYSPGWHELGTTLEIFVNKQKLESLPKDLQMIIETATERLNMWVLCEFEVKNAEYLQKIKAEGKVEFRTFSDEILDALRAYNQELMEIFVAKDAFAQKVYDSYSKFRKNATEWAGLTEKVYYQSIL